MLYYKYLAYPEEARRAVSKGADAVTLHFRTLLGDDLPLVDELARGHLLERHLDDGSRAMRRRSRAVRIVRAPEMRYIKITR